MTVTRLIMSSHPPHDRMVTKGLKRTWREMQGDTDTRA